jgi:hypothetical protein
MTFGAMTLATVVTPAPSWACDTPDPFNPGICLPVFPPAGPAGVGTGTQILPGGPVPGQGAYNAIPVQACVEVTLLGLVCTTP